MCCSALAQRLTKSVCRIAKLCKCIATLATLSKVLELQRRVNGARAARVHSSLLLAADSEHYSANSRLQRASRKRLRLFADLRVWSTSCSVHNRYRYSRSLANSVQVCLRDLLTTLSLLRRGQNRAEHSNICLRQLIYGGSQGNRLRAGKAC